jgi:hypothetical protein
MSKILSNVTAKQVIIRNIIHSILGWIYLFGITVPLLTGWYGTSPLTNGLFGIMLGGNAISFFSYLYLKFFQSKI